MRRALAMMVVLSLAGCGAADEPAPAPAAPAAEQAVTPPGPSNDFSRPINLLGTEPFWSLQIRPDRLTFSAPDQTDIVATNPGPVVSGDQAVWTGDAESGPVLATLISAVCQDGMSGLLYPFRALVEIEGRALQGCGAYADAMPREAP